MDDAARIAMNICGLQLAIINTSSKKLLLYQFAWKMLKLIENKKFLCWHAQNFLSPAHLPMIFMGILHQLFKKIVLFSQNSVNTNSVELNLVQKNLDTKVIAIAMKLAAKFFHKMSKHAKLGSHGGKDYTKVMAISMGMGNGDNCNLVSVVAYLDTGKYPDWICEYLTHPHRLESKLDGSAREGPY